MQPAPDHVPPDWPHGSPPQQVHPDLWVDDREAAHAEVMALGARLHAADAFYAGEGWQVYADPAGHPICLCWNRSVSRRPGCPERR